MTLRTSDDSIRALIDMKNMKYSDKLKIKQDSKETGSNRAGSNRAVGILLTYFLSTASSLKIEPS